MVRNDEGLGLEATPTKDERGLARRLEVARQERGGPLAGAELQHQAPVVDRPAAVGVRGVQGLERPSSALDPVAPPHPAQRGSLLTGEVEHAAHRRIVLGPGREPDLADLEVLEDRGGAADVIGVTVRQRQDRHAPLASREDRRDHEAFPRVEPPRFPRARVHDDDLAGDLEHDREALAHVEDVEP
jgi:hypothetical protein